jgi:glucose-1-phosphate cytidylyltransferase
VKAVILAGGMGTRISEESHLRPKPMIEIGGRPILWHIMKIYACHGVADFVICLGYKGYMIKEYFANYVLHASDVTIDAGSGEITYHQNLAEPWRITLVDTGDVTLTGGRLKRARRYLEPEGPFCMTYGDGVADIDVTALVRFHRSRGRLATVTAVVPPGRYGALAFDGDDRVTRFTEKPPGDNAFVNGGFFVLEPEVIELIEGDATAWEEEPLERLAASGQLSAYRHTGFWQAMDTMRDKSFLEAQWSSGAAPWKIWSDAKGRADETAARLSIL